jgi:hypothetical protein
VPGFCTGTVRDQGGKASSLSSLPSLRGREGGAPRVRFVLGPPWPTGGLRKPSVLPELRSVAGVAWWRRPHNPQNEGA